MAEHDPSPEGRDRVVDLLLASGLVVLFAGRIVGVNGWLPTPVVIGVGLVLFVGIISALVMRLARVEGVTRAEVLLRGMQGRKRDT
jgi:hypothetical protein